MESRDEVAEKVAALADAVLGVAAETGDPALQRSAAEMFAFAACIGSTPLAASLLRTLCDAMARSPSAPRWGPLSLMTITYFRQWVKAITLRGHSLQAMYGLTGSCMALARFWLSQASPKHSFLH